MEPTALNTSLAETGTRTGTPPGQTPVVFVYAAERSGTTVFRLMLNAHPEINNPIESDFLFDYISRPADGGDDAWRYDLEAMKVNLIFWESKLELPDTALAAPEMLEAFLAQYAALKPGPLIVPVHRNLGRIAALRPDAKIIHLLRDPRDVARSSIGMGWAGMPLYGVEKWHVAEHDWDLHAHSFADENRLTLRYEELILDFEGGLRRVCDFLDVDFHEAMLTYHEGTTYEAPDPALIYQWKRKMADTDVALVERRLGDLVTTRGYELSGLPVARPGTLARLGYWARNKLAVWKMSSQRYGFFNVLAEKVGRRLGLKSLELGARRRISEISEAHLR